MNDIQKKQRIGRIKSDCQCDVKINTIKCNKVVEENILGLKLMDNGDAIGKDGIIAGSWQLISEGKYQIILNPERIELL